MPSLSLSFGRELWDISDRFSESYGIDLGIFIGLLFVGPVGT
jgi:hypothetical protein